jgi:hypothetical protein
MNCLPGVPLDTVWASSAPQTGTGWLGTRARPSRRCTSRRHVEQARWPELRRNMTSQTHGYRKFVRVAASTGTAIAELDSTDLAAARAEALGHIWAYSRRQRS